MLDKIILIFSNSMSFLYLLVGLFILIRVNLMDLENWQRISIGIIVIGYGVFRISRTIMKYNSERKEKHNET